MVYKLLFKSMIHVSGGSTCDDHALSDGTANIVDGTDGARKGAVWEPADFRLI